MGKKKETKPLGIIFAEPFGAQISCFGGVKELREWGDATGLDTTKWDLAAYGMAVRDHDKSGVALFAMALRPDARIETLVHECSHMVDFIHDECGVPVELENTEIRAYQLGALVADAAEVFGFSWARGE